MRSGLISLAVVGLAMWSSLSLGCRDKADPKATREECTKVAEHIADLIMAHNTANPDQWWESVHTQSAIEHGIPAEVRREAFADWLRSPQGETWKLLRRGQTVAGVQQGIDACVDNATRATVKCLLGATSKAEVHSCDEKAASKRRAPAPPPTAPAGSAAGGSGSAM